MHWSDIAITQPRLAQLAQERLIDPGVVLVATIRHGTSFATRGSRCTA